MDDSSSLFLLLGSVLASLAGEGAPQAQDDVVRIAVEEPSQVPASAAPAASVALMLEVSFRALGSRGQPLAGQDYLVDARGVANRSFSTSFLVRTDASGVARTAVFEAEPGTERGRIRIGARLPGSDGMYARAQVEVSEFVQGLNSLGDVDLLTPGEAYPEPLVTGKLVDSVGRALVGIVALPVLGLFEPVGSKPGIRSLVVNHSYAGSPRPERPLTRVAARWQATPSGFDGGFAIHGPRPEAGQGLTLLGTRPVRGMPALRIGELPATNVEWRAPVKDVARGRFLLPEGWPTTGLALSSVQGKYLDGALYAQGEIRPDGSFEHALWPGHCGLLLSCGERPQSPGLWKLDERQLEHARTGRVFELGEIDLRDRLRGIRFEVRDGVGKPVENARALIRAGTLKEFETLATYDLRSGPDGVVELLVQRGDSEPRVSISVQGPGESNLHGDWTNPAGPFPGDEVPGVLVVGETAGGVSSK